MRILRFLNYGTTYKYLKFGFFGIFTYIIKIVVTYILKEYFGIHYLLSYSIILILIAIIGFVFNFYLVFRNRSRKIKKFGLYVTVYITSILADILFVALLTDLIKVQYTYSITISTFIIFTCKFFVYNYFVFKE